MKKFTDEYFDREYSADTAAWLKQRKVTAEEAEQLVLDNADFNIAFENWVNENTDHGIMEWDYDDLGRFFESIGFKTNED